MIQTISFFYCKLLSVILDCKIIYEHTINANIGPGKKCFLCTLIDSGGGVGVVWMLFTLEEPLCL